MRRRWPALKAGLGVGVIRCLLGDDDSGRIRFGEERHRETAPAQLHVARAALRKRYLVSMWFMGAPTASWHPQLGSCEAMEEGAARTGAH
jgi:hypothetical protein